MANLVFTANLARHTDCPPASLAAASVAELFAQYFASRPAVRGFVLDDQGEVRRHVKVLIDGRNLRDRKRLSDPLRPQSTVHVFQALSGG